MTCDQLEEVHQAFVIARLAYHCSDSHADATFDSNQKSECESLILHDAMQCSAENKVDQQWCMLQSVTKQDECHSANETICNVMHRLINFPVQARQAFCSKSGGGRGGRSGRMAGDGCDVGTMFQCTTSIISAALSCATQLSLKTVYKCVEGFLGAAKGHCRPCICTVAGNIPGLTDEC